MKHLFLKLDETLTLLGQADALRRVGDLPGVFAIAAHGDGYRVNLAQPSHSLSVVKGAREINCVQHIIPCGR